MFKNVTDNQGLGFARMARAKRISRKQLADAEEDGTIGRFLDGIKAGLPITIGSIEYPDWVEDHLTWDLEAPTVRNPGKVELWLDSRQQSGNQYPTGHEVYAAIKAGGLLERSLSLGDLKWYEQHPDQIPAEFHGKLIYGWAAVVRDSGGRLRIPSLRCFGGQQPCVDWYDLDDRLNGHGPAGLRKFA